MSEPPILQYHVRRRVRWRRWGLFALLVGLLVGSILPIYRRVIQPRLLQAALDREHEREFAELINHKPPVGPVGIVVFNQFLDQHADALDRYGSTRGYQEYNLEYNPPDKFCVRLLRNGTWFGLMRHYDFQIGTTVFLQKLKTPDGRDFLVGLDATVNGRLFRFYPTTLDLQTKNVEHDIARLLVTKPYVPLAEFSFIEGAAYVLPGQPDSADSSAFSFDVIHGDHRDHVACRLQNDGSVTISPTVDPDIENRWDLHPKR